MIERKTITLIYEPSDNWIGGSYYFTNIIKALNFLPDSLKPALTIAYSKNASIKILQDINYPYISFTAIVYKFNLISKAINKIYYFLFDKYAIKAKVPGQNLYPVNSKFDVSKATKYYFWITDFQDKYLPEYFSEFELKNRLKNQNYIVEQQSPIILSSETSRDDFNKFFPANKSETVVLPFVSVIGEGYKSIDINTLKSKYKIDQPYFMVPNQFWKHKNQEIVLKAVNILKSKGYRFKVVFTGKENAYRTTAHIDYLKNYIKINGLQDYFLFLGFIDRDEQLQLMKNSVAIIQPSLFEGWSTVVEDAKAIDHFIILSDIPLHIEQIKTNCAFFNPYNEQQLASAIEKYFLNAPVLEPTFYHQNIEQFSNKLLSIF